MNLHTMVQQATQGSPSSGLLQQGLNAYSGIVESGRMLIGGTTRIVTELFYGKEGDTGIEQEPGHFSFLNGGVDSEDIPYKSFGERMITQVAECKPLPTVAQAQGTRANKLPIQKEAEAELIISTGSSENTKTARAEKSSRIPRPVKGAVMTRTSEPKTQEKTSKPSGIPRPVRNKAATTAKGAETVTRKETPKTEVGFLTAVQGPVYLDGKTPGAENMQRFESNIRRVEFRRPGEKTTKGKKEFSKEFHKRQADLQKARKKHREEQPVTRPTGKKVSGASAGLMRRPEHKSHAGHMPIAQFNKFEFPETLRTYPQETKS
ncbi:MAG: hypothetical protein ACR2PT_16815 [Endozoicomonas sp.]